MELKDEKELIELFENYRKRVRKIYEEIFARDNSLYREGDTTAAGPLGIGVLKGKTGPLEIVNKVEGRTLDVLKALRIDHYIDITKIKGNIIVPFLVHEVGILIAAASAALNRYTKISTFRYSIFNEVLLDPCNGILCKVYGLVICW